MTVQENATSGETRSVSEEQVLEVLRNVEDPDPGQDLVSLNLISDLSIRNGRVGFTIQLSTPAGPAGDRLKSEAERHVGALPGVRRVDVELDAETIGRPIEGGLEAETEQARQAEDTYEFSVSVC